MTNLVNELKNTNNNSEFKVVNLNDYFTILENESLKMLLLNGDIVYLINSKGKFLHNKYKSLAPYFEKFITNIFGKSSEYQVVNIN